MLEKLGMKVEDEEVAKERRRGIDHRDAAALYRAGNKLDITVNSIGDTSVSRWNDRHKRPARNGSNVYAVAQGPVVIGKGTGGACTPPWVTCPAARSSKDVQQDSAGNRKMYRLTLHNPDITTAVRVAHGESGWAANTPRQWTRRR